MCFKKFGFIILLLTVLIACDNSKKETKKTSEQTSTEQVAANLKSVAVDIEGMTCEIGCAKTIESKLSKVDGITYSDVNFESKKGVFTYDTNKLTTDDIAHKIDNIAGGDVYSATKITDLEETIN